MAKKKKFGFNWDEIESKQEEQENSGGYKADLRFYKVKTNKEGVFLGTIRFLPPAEGECVARVPYHNHYFQKSAYYVELCPKTIGKQCPVCEHTMDVYNEFGKDAAKKKNKGMYQKSSWISNILVINDPENPENEGKVFLYKYGFKIKEKLDEARNPKDPDEAKINPFDFYEGSDFRFNVYTQKFDGKDMPQYDKCKFKPTTELYDGDDDKLEKLYSDIYKLSEFNEDSHFEEYDKLKIKFDKVMGNKVSSEESTNSDFDSFVGKDKDEDKKETSKEEPKKEESKDKSDAIDMNIVDDDGDDDMAAFYKTVKESD